MLMFFQCTYIALLCMTSSFNIAFYHISNTRCYSYANTHVINVGNLECTSQSLQERILHTPIQNVAKTTDSKL